MQTTTPTRNTAALRALQFATRHRLLRRGNSWILRSLPGLVWGGNEVTVDTDLGPMRLPTRERSASALMLYGHIPHEERETALIRSLVSTCQAAIDVGAHYGWYARIMSERCPRVVGIEPDPETHRFARVNAPKAEVIHAAVGRSSGKLTLYLGATRDLNSVVRKVGRPVEVPAVTLDQICEDRGLSEVDFVKCDVEGGEFEVLAGAERLLSNPHPPIWMIEVSDAFLAQAGTSAAEVARMLRKEVGHGDFYGLPTAGAPVHLDRIESAHTGLSNVFYVPAARREQFRRAVDALLDDPHAAAVGAGPADAVDRRA